MPKLLPERKNNNKEEKNTKMKWNAISSKTFFGTNGNMDTLPQNV